MPTDKVLSSPREEILGLKAPFLWLKVAHSTQRTPIVLKCGVK